MHCRINHCGQPISSWTETAQEYEVVQRFPELGKRFETGHLCLTLKGLLIVYIITSK